MEEINIKEDSFKSLSFRRIKFEKRMKSIQLKFFFHQMVVL
jgi:hypothetical protein